MAYFLNNKLVLILLSMKASTLLMLKVQNIEALRISVISINLLKLVLMILFPSIKKK